MSIHLYRLEEIDEDQYTSEEDEEMMDTCSSPSIPDENIDFDLVYALHTFTATVEGQVSVEKGDSLVLMEDTNTYWWLVEVLHTREAGYIPAENIETPYERLARLNKHRNVEIASPLLHDVTPLIYPLDITSRHVTIQDEINIYHYEVESEFEEDQEDEAEITSDPQNTYNEMKMEEEPVVIEQPDMPSQQANSLPLQEFRVFAGNIGQGPLFHTFPITYQTATDELVKLAVHRFGVQEEHNHSITVEYYVAVQGLDGDEYILSAQDKPLSIFKTLTDSLTTPMPSLSNYRLISQQPASPAQSTGRRHRSSSFSNYEQTNHEEDSVIRFYLHRRIKHAQESLVYIKVALYPDTHKQKKPHEMDRMDKVIAVHRESTIGQVIQLALEKFHVPDSEEKGWKQLKKYKLSVKSHHGEKVEVGLDSKEIMSNILENLSSNTITSELLFILRKSGRRKYYFIQERRPSILDILATPKNEKTRSDERNINREVFQSSLFHFTRRSSAPCTDSLMENNNYMAKSNITEKKKESLKQQFKRLVGWGSATNTNTKKQLSVVTSQSDILTQSAMTPKLSIQENNTSTLEIVTPIPPNDDPVSQESAVSLTPESIHELPEDPEEQGGAQEDTEKEQEEPCEETTEEEEEEEEEELVEESSPLVSHLSSKVSLVSESSSIPHTALPQITNKGQQDLDDLYLLVAHGVDFLKTREDTKWEEEGGYEFHPWNRPQSSFAVRPKDKKAKPTIEEKQPLSPPLTPLPLQQPESEPEQLLTEDEEKELALSVAKRILSGKKSEESFELSVDGSEPKPVSLDDQELQRIVAAHIVF